METAAIYRYLDYRRFLRERLEGLRKGRSGFSLSRLSQKTHGLSKAHLSLVLNGKRNLSSSKIETLGKAIGLNAPGLRYFHSLVCFNQARSPEERELFLEQMVALRPRRADRNLGMEEALVLRSWHALALRELVKLPGFDPDPVAISRRFRGRMRPVEAARALELLVATGLVSHDADGTWRSTDEVLRSTDEVPSTMVQSYHRSCLELGKESPERDPIATREFASINVALSDDEFRALKLKLKRLRDEVGQLGGEGSGERRLYQLNFQLFTLSEAGPSGNDSNQAKKGNS